MLNIAVLEDHDELRDLIAQALVSSGHQVLRASDAEHLQELLSSSSIDLLITDLNLPGEGGISVAKRLRDSMPGLYIIMITALGGLTDRIAGYESGADLYLSKPFSMQELLAAVHNINRRFFSRSVGKVGDVFQLNIAQQELNGVERVQLSRTETILLKTLILSRDRRAETFVLLENTGRLVDERSKSSLEVQMARLRLKFKAAGFPRPAIRSIRGDGYELLVPIELV
jgi:DNA-binding response OmpR family regulator